MLALPQGAGQAVIVNRSGNAAVYRVSDRIEGDPAVVDAVYPTWVRLSKNGQFTRLSLPEVNSLASPPPAPGSALQRRANAFRSRPSANEADEVTRLLEQMAGGEQLRLTDLLRPQPVFDNGELKGYRVYPGRDRQAFARLGLRPGDLVTQLNGTSLSNPADGMAMFKQLEGRVPLAVTLERNGAVETLVLDPSQVSID